MLFYETYFEESNVDQKCLIWSQYKIIMKLGQKKSAGMAFRKVYKNYPKIKKKMLFYETYFEEGNIN